ncbi:TPA: hypothetical protein R4G84_002866 [Salmonella enterica subsp. enterica serovar Mississippi]|nr:hypothetical protein [Salmonella enterica subsp. enterica]ECW0789055.1 hypothetical protein [Salmonella enterica subsp. enterica]HED0167987.1 hypothetical protein [Salmonella enterica subsp. enterica serovar Mississippi]HED0173851.1 hypothetical protein [Salmonella enterica subsp. enterica serovar Mississippi]HED0195970.1 hypothetical protein [Salmonella enterica subsp. enterica serovar Mississippi]
MTIDNFLQIDPFTHGAVMGWGVVRFEPWCLAGVFETEHKAKDLATKLGTDYEVFYGSYKLGTASFIWGIEL